MEYGVKMSCKRIRREERIHQTFSRHITKRYHCLKELYTLGRTLSEMIYWTSLGNELRMKTRFGPPENCEKIAFRSHFKRFRSHFKRSCSHSRRSHFYFRKFGASLVFIRLTFLCKFLMQHIHDLLNLKKKRKIFNQNISQFDKVTNVIRRKHITLILLNFMT